MLQIVAVSRVVGRPAIHQDQNIPVPSYIQIVFGIHTDAGLAFEYFSEIT